MVPMTASPPCLTWSKRADSRPGIERVDAGRTEDYNRISISNFDIANQLTENGMDGRELYSGLIRLHILYHACEEPIFGLGIMEELARHGHKVSAGTLYPMLHSMERKGYLRSRAER